MAKLDEVQEVEYSLDFVLYNQELKNRMKTKLHYLINFSLEVFQAVIFLF